MSEAKLVKLSSNTPSSMRSGSRLRRGRPLDTPPSEITDDTEYAYEIANKSPVLCPRDFEGTEVEFEDNLVRVLAGCFESDPQMRPKFDEICDVLRDEAARFKSTTSSSELNELNESFCSDDSFSDTMRW